jgi:hypothetical protein
LRASCILRASFFLGRNQVGKYRGPRGHTLVTYDGEFFQEEGLPGRFTINLPSDEDIVLDGEEDEVADMQEDTAQDEVEEVQNQQDLNFLERFRQGLDAEDSVGPPPGFVEDSWN